MTLIALMGALALAAVHLLSPFLTWLDTRPRSNWLSIGSGISVAYVFVHLLPELAHRQEHATGILVEPILFILALLGFTTFYGLERHGRGSDDRVFRLHMGSFAVYNVLVGHLLIDEMADGLRPGLFFTLAMLVHFVVNDRALYGDHGKAYLNSRWMLAAAPIIGWLIGVFFPFDLTTMSFALALLAGSVVLNVIKEELPTERESHFGAFAVGAAAYTALLVAL